MTVDPLEVIRDFCSLRERPGDPVPLGVSVQPFKDGAIVRLFDGRRKARMIVGVAGIEPRVECLETEDRLAVNLRQSVRRRRRLPSAADQD
jgi:hypothetical protein